MDAGAASDGVLRAVFNGCISGPDTGIKRRPYHRNCGCALHKLRGNCSHPSGNKNVSYPIRRSWSEGCLALATASATTTTTTATNASPCSSPVVTEENMAGRRNNSCVVFSIDDDEDVGSSNYKV